MPLDDPIGNGKTQSHSLIAFRGEKWVEYLPQVFLADAGSGVGYLYAGVFFLFRVCLDGDTAAAGHGLAGVKQNIYEDLLHLVFIDRNKRQIRLVVPDDVNIVKARLATNKGEGGLHDGVEGHRFFLRYRFAGKIE